MTSGISVDFSNYEGKPDPYIITQDRQSDDENFKIKSNAEILKECVELLTVHIEKSQAEHIINLIGPCIQGIYSFSLYAIPADSYSKEALFKLYSVCEFMAFLLKAGVSINVNATCIEQLFSEENSDVWVRSYDKTPCINEPRERKQLSSNEDMMEEIEDQSESVNTYDGIYDDDDESTPKFMNIEDWPLKFWEKRKFAKPTDTCAFIIDVPNADNKPHNFIVISGYDYENVYNVRTAITTVLGNQYQDYMYRIVGNLMVEDGFVHGILTKEGERLNDEFLQKR